MEQELPERELLERELLEVVDDFVRRDVLPVVADLERADTYPAELVARMAEIGLFGAGLPERYGGLGVPAATYAKIVERLAYGWMTLSGLVNTHSVVGHLVARHGTEQQRASLLPRMATGEVRGAISLSESDAGSDLGAMRCRARRDADGWVVDGTKMWVTSGERAGVVALLAVADEGVTCFLVEKEPGPRYGGITVSRHVDKLGYRGVETVEMLYDGHRLPPEAVLGGEAGVGQGLRMMLGGLEIGRINIAARAVGLATAAFDAAVSYAQQRETFGVPIVEHQAIQFKIADMATGIEAARALTQVAAHRWDAGERADVEAGMAKLFASETAFTVAQEAMRIHGGFGYTTEFPVERFLRDAPLMLVGEGTNEIQRIVITRGLLRRDRAGHDTA